MFKRLFAAFALASLSLTLSASVTSTVQVFGEPLLGQSLSQANAASGPWHSQELSLALLPRHSYVLHVRTQLDQGSHPVFLQPYFRLDDGRIVPLARIQARAQTNTVQSLSGIVAPLGADTLHYQLTGDDSSVSWWRDLQVEDEGLLFDGLARPAFGGDLSMTAERLWVAPDSSFDLTLAHGGELPFGTRAEGAELDRQTVFRLGQGHGLVHGEPSAEALRLTWEACGAADGAPAMGLMIQAQPGDAWILPFNDGLRVPVANARDIGTQELPVRAGHFMSLPLFGIQRGEGILLVINETPADALLRFWPHDDQAGFRWQTIKGSWGGPRSLRLQWIAHGGLPAMAAAYRRYRDSVEPVNSLGDKATQIPGLSLMAGALDLHFFKRASVWSREADPAAMVAALREAGLDRVLWSQASSLEGVLGLNSAGYVSGRYENFQDAYPPETALAWMSTEGWPRDLVLKEDGQWLHGWAAKEGQRVIYAGVRSAEAALQSVRDYLGRETLPYRAVFLDTTTATGPREDWSTAHPLTRARDLEFKTKQLEAASLERRLVTGSESGHDGSINAVHYFEGMLSPWIGRFDDAGYDLVTRKPVTPAMQEFNVSAPDRIPLFELCYHDCVVNYPYWGDASNRLPETWRFRDLLSCLYGQPQLWVMDGELWKDEKDQATKSYATWSPVVRHLFGQKMTDWKALDPSGQVQETHWQDGSVVRVDFAHDRLDLSGPVAAAPRARP